MRPRRSLGGYCDTLGADRTTSAVLNSSEFIRNAQAGVRASAYALDSLASCDDGRASELEVGVAELGSESAAAEHTATGA